MLSLERATRTLYEPSGQSKNSVLSIEGRNMNRRIYEYEDTTLRIAGHHLLLTAITNALKKTFTKDDLKRIYLYCAPQNDCFLRRCEKGPKMQSISLQSLHLDEDDEICFRVMGRRRTRQQGYGHFRLPAGIGVMMLPMSGVETEANGKVKFTGISGYMLSLLQEALRFKVKLSPTPRHTWGDRIIDSAATALAASPFGMQYEVEGTSITPEDLQEGVWKSVFRQQMNAHAAFVSKRQKEKATREAARTAQRNATPSSITPTGKREMDPAKPLNGFAQKRRPTLSRLLMEYIKVVFRSRGFDPITYGASTLMMAIFQLLPPLQSQPQEKIHPNNRTFTVSTPDQGSARRLGAVTSLTLGDRTFQVSAYVAMPETSTRIVVPEALCMGRRRRKLYTTPPLTTPN
ncbi:hypothetical protein HPB47_011760 [Ixodes persulcatus]|uniref:Uncharacterized protein n=1 Tax=Ixodes persulcatus TaxID=34615 RepID=A0AC60NVG1_IXOPE|nr:hypothetical protein HPB47_011760 [Ixodes persulcatus]